MICEKITFIVVCAMTAYLVVMVSEKTANWIISKIPIKKEAEK